MTRKKVIHKIIWATAVPLMMISSFTSLALETYNNKTGSNILCGSAENNSVPYNGHLRIYITEPESRWDMYNHQPYHFGFLGFTFDETLSIDYLDTYKNTIIWNGDVTEDNVMVIAAVFNSDIHQGYARPPNRNPFDPCYVDAAAAAIPESTGSNIVTEDFTHTVFIEEGTATWCPYCPAMANALYNIYQSGDYPLYFVALIDDKHPDAHYRLRHDYNIYGFPTAFFDGGYQVYVGGDPNEAPYRTRIETCGKT